MDNKGYVTGNVSQGNYTLWGNFTFFKSTSLGCRRHMVKFSILR
jgi:hypothetical protein